MVYVVSSCFASFSSVPASRWPSEMVKQVVLVSNEVLNRYRSSLLPEIIT